MPFDLRTVMDRAEVLLQDLDPTADRRIRNAMVRADASAEDADSIWPNTPGASFLLKQLGKPGEPQQGIGRARVQRYDALELTISRYSGGRTAVTDQLDELERKLGEDWDDAVEVLRWPNNHRRAETGWLVAKDFTSGRPVLRGNRYFQTGRFRVLWWKVV